MTLSLDHITVTVADGSDTMTILDDVSLRVEAGEVVALTGLSGSGKSTLLAVAGLLRRPDHGRVTVAGVDATALKRSAQARLRQNRIGIIYQASNLFPSLTAIEQLELVAHISGRLDAAAKRQARELLVAVGLDSRMNARPSQLSGGERQRVGIARALMNDPVVLLADEPTASLDPARGQAVMDLIVDQARQRGAAALIVTHAPQQVSGANRSVSITQGHLADLQTATF